MVVRHRRRADDVPAQAFERETLAGLPERDGMEGGARKLDDRRSVRQRVSRDGAQGVEALSLLEWSLPTNYSVRA